MRVAMVAVGCVAALALACCTEAPTPTAPRTGARGDPAVTDPATSVTAALAETYGPALAITAVEGVPLDEVQASRVAPVTSDLVWVAGTREPQLDVGAPVAGVWRGPVGGVGTWYPFGSVEGLTVTPDGAAWVVSGTALARFDGTEWRRLLGPAGTPLSGLGAPVAGQDGSVWLPSGYTSLVSVNRGRVLVLEAGPTAPRSEAIAVLADGTAWIGGDAWAGGWLRRFDGITWGTADPWDEPDDVAMYLAADPAGVVWAWLLSGYDPWGGSPEPEHVALARRAAGGGWDLWIDPPRVANVSSMTAVDGAVWLVTAAGLGDPCRDRGRLLHFDGTTWSRAAGGTDVAAVHGTSPGGDRLWVTTCHGEVRSLPTRLPAGRGGAEPS